MAKASTARLRDRPSNVISFPGVPGLRRALRCEEARTAVCAHCGGLLGDDESEEDCSSIRVSRSS